MLYGLIMLVVPAALVGAHLNWPYSTPFLVAANAAVILIGSVYLVALGERISGARSFAMPFVCLAALTLLGGMLSARYGWTSTGFLLATYAALCVAEGFRTRSERRRMTA